VVDARGLVFLDACLRRPAALRLGKMGKLGKENQVSHFQSVHFVRQWPESHKM